MSDTFCPECGWDVSVDEDGLCTGCGATAIGVGVRKLVLERNTLRRELAEARQELGYAQMSGDVLRTIRAELQERYGEECTFFDDAVHHVLITLEAKIADRDAQLAERERLLSVLRQCAEKVSALKMQQHEDGTTTIISDGDTIMAAIAALAAARKILEEEKPA